MLYRVLTNRLTKGEGVLRRGATIDSDQWQPDTIAKLAKLGFIAPVSAPPLSALAKWRTRATKLQDIGIKLATDLLNADLEIVAEHMDVRPSTVARWKAEIRKELEMEQPNYGPDINGGERP